MKPSGSPALNSVMVLALFAAFVHTPNLTPSNGPAQAAEEVNWPMAGANPQRTSWVSTTLPDVIATQWVKPIFAHVQQKVQVIGAEGKVYVSTSMGLYAFDAATGADIWQYATALPLGNSPTYVVEDGTGYLYVGGLDKMIHKIRASNGQGVWKTVPVDGGYSSNPIVVNDKVYATSRDGALYAFSTSDGSQAWKFQTGNQIYQSPAFMPEDDGIASTSQGSLYFASNDGYGYAVDAGTGAQIWQSDADPTTPAKDKFPSMGFYAWWPVIYGQDVIFMRSGFYASNGPESSWFFGSSPNTNMFAGTTSFETQAGYWPVGEKFIDVRTNPNGYTISDYFETQQPTDTRPQHGPFRRNAFFVDRVTGSERQFDLDNDGHTDAAPVLWVGDNGAQPPPIVSGYNGVLYFNSVIRARGTSFNARSVIGWKVGTPFVSVTADWYRSSDEPTGITGAGDKVYANHCCDRQVYGINISRPNTDNTSDPPREWSYINGGGLSYFSWPLDVSGLPNTQTDYYYKEAVKFFWDPQPNLDPPCCAAVFWNENDKVGPAVYNGRLYVILGNALVALGAGGAGANAPLLASAPPISPPTLAPNVTGAQIQARLESEITKLVQAGHLKPSIMGNGRDTARDQDEYLGTYWHNPADTLVILLRAMPYLSPSLQSQVRAYLQSEVANYNPALYLHVGFGSGTQRDPWPYPPTDPATRLFNPPQSPQGSTSFDGWGFPPSNVYALWKYAQAGLGNASTLFSQWGTRLRAPISVHGLTDDFLIDHPLVLNGYIAGYKGYVELAKLAGQPQSVYGPYESEYNRLLQFRVANLTTFPNSENSAASSYRGYYPTLITYYNFAYLTPELGDYLRINARSNDPDRDILAILQRYQEMAPHWMMVHNGETQGEMTIQPYQQEHSLFQALAMVKHASQSELIKYLDTPIVPVGDLYYIDNLVATLEAGSPGPAPIFADVPASHPYFREIEALYRAGFTAGCATDPLRFCPDQTMNRAESAVFVVRGVHGTEFTPTQPTAQRFADLPLDSWAAGWADALFADGYTAGCGTDPLVYCPWQGHTRAEGSVFYLRMLNGAAFEPPPAQGTFGDLPVSHWAARWAEAAYAAGLIPACGEDPLRFCPDGPLSRGLAAYMMVQAKGLE